MSALQRDYLKFGQRLGFGCGRASSRRQHSKAVGRKHFVGSVCELLNVTGGRQADSMSVASRS